MKTNLANLTWVEIWSIIAGTLAGVILIINAIEKITNLIKTIKAPNVAQNERIDEMDKRFEKLERRFDKMEDKINDDHDRFVAIDESNRITQRALLALLDHGIDGNNIDQMQHAKEELHNHLINR